MVNCDSLRKQAASQSTKSPQLTKYNTTAPVHIGLCTVLALYPLQLLSSSKEDEDEDKDKDKEKKGERGLRVK